MRISQESIAVTTTRYPVILSCLKGRGRQSGLAWQAGANSMRLRCNVGFHLTMLIEYRAQPKKAYTKHRSPANKDPLHVGCLPNKTLTERGCGSSQTACSDEVVLVVAILSMCSQSAFLSHALARRYQSNRREVAFLIRGAELLNQSILYEQILKRCPWRWFIFFVESSSRGVEGEAQFQWRG